MDDRHIESATLPLAEAHDDRNSVIAPYGRWCPYCGANLSGVPVEREKPEEAVFALAGHRLKVILAVLFVVIWLAAEMYDWFDDPATVLLPGWYSALGALLLFYLLGFSPIGLLRRR